MGVTRIESISKALISHGLSGSTPVAMIRWATTGRQQTVAAPWLTSPRSRRRRFQAARLTVIGDVVRLRNKLNCLRSVRCLAAHRSHAHARPSRPLTHLLLERGADVLEIPTIRILPPTGQYEIADALLELNAYDWLVFTSPNGVAAFFELFFKAFDDLRDIGGVRIAAVGPATADKLRGLHLRVDATPKKLSPPTWPRPWPSRAALII